MLPSMSHWLLEVEGCQLYVDETIVLRALANNFGHLGLVDDVRLALWPSIPVFVALVWLLTTYAIFPAAVTERHYLNVAPIIGLMCISV